MQRAADDVMILQLQLPAGEQLQFLAGQYIDILLKDGKRRSYSLAKPPHAQGPIDVHIRHTPGGLFTDFVFGTQTQVMKERDILRFEGPLGSFFLREDTDKPIVMLASGTGFAPIKSIIEHMMQADIQRPITLYWGGRRPQDLYLNALCLEWANTLPYFTYVPVISDAMPQDNWQGRIGFVHQAVLDDLSDLSGHHVYACGAPIMVDTARATFTTQAGLPDHDFFADAFISENDLQAVS
jgi:CDP-4-dehydro-6-deoxyglucose reductase